MPETRGEKLFFGVVMSITMAVGMEIYNVAISMGYALQPGGLSGMTNAVFPAALAEAAYMLDIRVHLLEPLGQPSRSRAGRENYPSRTG